MCWFTAILGAEESTTPDSLQNVGNANLGGDLKEIMKDNRLLARMYPLLFRTEEEGVEILETPEHFEQYRGKRIARINIIPQDVFNLPKKAEDSVMYAGVVYLGNALHPKASEHRIRKQLIFTEGDSLNPEFLISNLQYLYDQALFSEIAFEIVDTDEDEVQINVFIREKFFLQFKGKYISKDKFSLGITDRSFFGTGHSLENTWYVDPENQGTIGWESSFKNPNILGGFVQGNLHLADKPGQRLAELKVERPFIYPLFRYSGGSEMSTMSIYPPKDSLSVKKMEAGGWIARNFDLFEYPRFAYAALSINRDWYPKRPSSDEETGMPWQESFFALGALALTQSSYRYMPRVSSFLDNDYLPVGYLLELYGGVDLGEYKNRPFAGIHGSFSFFPDQDQYFYLKSAIEGFFADGKVEEGVLAFAPEYISKTAHLGKLKARSLFSGRYIHSHRILSTQSLSLQSHPFYRGTKDLRGTDLVYASVEEDLSLPISLLGFQITTFGFADMAFMTDDRRETDKKRSLFSQGLGFRLRNPSLIWDFIEIFFSVDQSFKSRPGFGVELRLKSAVGLDGFMGRRPARYEFL